MKKLIGCAIALVFMMMIGCSPDDKGKSVQGDLGEKVDAKVISNLILYQYGKELNTWKALSPKVTE